MRASKYLAVKKIVERLLRFVKLLNMRKVVGPGDFTRAGYSS